MFLFVEETMFLFVTVAEVIAEVIKFFRRTSEIDDVFNAESEM